MAQTRTNYYSRKIARLSRRVEEHRREFESNIGEKPAEDEAMHYLREGFGPCVSLYIESRTGGRLIEYSEDEFETLESAMNSWLDLYVRCYGVEAEHDHTLREAAKLLIDTHNVHDTARVLTQVP
ncbi:MAG: hypothetical protein SXQ77_01170 [Halobacteria archaeon]|nr:hypothetical protein [Halobacteria archaeon]